MSRPEKHKSIALSSLEKKLTRELNDERSDSV